MMVKVESIDGMHDIGSESFEDNSKTPIPDAGAHRRRDSSPDHKFVETVAFEAGLQHHEMPASSTASGFSSNVDSFSELGSMSSLASSVDMAFAQSCEQDMQMPSQLSYMTGQSMPRYSFLQSEPQFFPQAPEQTFGGIPYTSRPFDDARLVPAPVGRVDRSTATRGRDLDGGRGWSRSQSCCPADGLPEFRCLDQTRPHDDTYHFPDPYHYAEKATGLRHTMPQCNPAFDPSFASHQSQANQFLQPYAPPHAQPWLYPSVEQQAMNVNPDRFSHGAPKGTYWTASQ